MNELLEGLDGVECTLKDIETHDTCLQRVLDKMEQAGLKLNKEKRVFRQSELRFLGHLVDTHGVRADPEKVNAISDLQEPTDVHELQRALDMINY
ncbi:hypothetical protein LDENG_00092580 [Lucifuga dentata]|nr:hypothetical protein LDENG_00092580 [Lucifuga dentata]